MMSPIRLFLLQRVSAIIMVPLVLGHLAMMIYAVQGGLSAAEILSRTQGNWFWASYYGLFVIAACLHAAIGLRTIIEEHTRINTRMLNLGTQFIFFVSMALGFRAVIAVSVG